MVRVLGQRIRAFVSTSFRPYDHVLLVDHVEKALGTGAEIEGHIDDNALYLKFVDVREVQAVRSPNSLAGVGRNQFRGGERRPCHKDGCLLVALH